MWPHSPGCVSFGKNHILQVILQLIHLRVSQPVVVHEPLWRYQLIQIRSLLVLGGFIHQWFIVVYIWLGLSCIIDYKLGCLGRMFWHQLLRILYLMLERRCRKNIWLLLYMLFFLVSPGYSMLLPPTVILNCSGSYFWGQQLQQKCAYVTCWPFGTIVLARWSALFLCLLFLVESHSLDE